MHITLKLKHIWGSTINSPSANPIMMAARDAGFVDARQINRDFCLINGKVTAIPFKQAEYLRRLHNGEDRIEALPDDVHKALFVEAQRLERWDKKHDTFSVMKPEFSLLSFTLGG